MRNGASAAVVRLTDVDGVMADITTMGLRYAARGWVYPGTDAMLLNCCLNLCNTSRRGVNSGNFVVALICYEVVLFYMEYLL